MKPRWLLETKDSFQEQQAALCDEIAKQGMEYHVMRDPMYLFFEDIDCRPDWPDDACVIVNGTQGLCRVIRERRPNWTPGAWDDQHNFRVSTYLSYLPESVMLNSDGVFLPWNLFCRNYLDLFDHVSACGKQFFIKPDGPRKHFDGQVVSIFNVREFIRCTNAGYRKMLPETMVFAAAAKEIADEEWRFVIRSGSVPPKLVACSPRRTDVMLPYVRWTPPDDVAKVALAAAEVYNPDQLYVIDVCLTPNGPQVIELNSFSAAGLYACDPAAIVAAATEAALVAYEAKRDGWTRNPTPAPIA